MGNHKSTVSIPIQPANTAHKPTHSKKRRFYKSGEQTHARLRLQLAKEGVDKARLRKYGLSIEDFLHMQASQNRQCALCSRSEDIVGMLVIDHDHTSKKVRALLCARCNTSLGHIESRGVIWFHNMISYLRQHASHLLFELQQLYSTKKVRHAIEELQDVVHCLWESVNLSTQETPIRFYPTITEQKKLKKALRIESAFLLEHISIMDQIKLKTLELKEAVDAFKSLRLAPLFITIHTISIRPSK